MTSVTIGLLHILASSNAAVAFSAVRVIAANKCSTNKLLSRRWTRRHYRDTIARPGNEVEIEVAPETEEEGAPLKYSEMGSIEPGQRFKTIGGLIVKTTGQTQLIHSVEAYAHEVVIVEGVGEGNKYLHNLDSAEKL